MVNIVPVKKNKYNVFLPASTSETEPRPQRNLAEGFVHTSHLTSEGRDMETLSPQISNSSYRDRALRVRLQSSDHTRKKGKPGEGRDYIVPSGARTRGLSRYLA